MAPITCIPRRRCCGVHRVISYSFIRMICTVHRSCLPVAVCTSTIFASSSSLCQDTPQASDNRPHPGQRAILALPPPAPLPPLPSQFPARARLRSPNLFFCHASEHCLPPTPSPMCSLLLLPPPSWPLYQFSIQGASPLEPEQRPTPERMERGGGEGCQRESSVMKTPGVDLDSAEPFATFHA